MPHFSLQGEGVAYRGRLLVELESKLGEEIDKELEVMKGPELIRVQVVQTICSMQTFTRRFLYVIYMTSCRYTLRANLHPTRVVVFQYTCNAVKFFHSSHECGGTFMTLLSLLQQIKLKEMP